MKRFYFYILISFFLSACANAPMEKAAYNEKPVSEFEYAENELADAKLEESLSGAIDSKEKLTSFEQRAVQKLQDFVNYLEIISNPEYDIVFRNQAKSMAESLFRDGKISENNLAPSIENMEINNFLTRLSENEFGEIAPAIQNVKVLLHFQETKASFFRATLSFDLFIKENSSNKTATVILTKITKQFGEQQKEVWEVFLEHIE